MSENKFIEYHWQFVSYLRVLDVEWYRMPICVDGQFCSMLILRAEINATVWDFIWRVTDEEKAFYVLTGGN